MASRRVTLARLLDAAGATGGLLRLYGRFGCPWLTVITYHHVCSPGPDYPFDAGAADVSPAELDEQVATLRRFFSLIRIDDLVAFFQGSPLPPNPALITFDDGYRSCHDVALPILRRHDATAAFFIPTDYVERRRLFWWDRLSYVVKRSRRSHIRLGYPAPIHLDLRPPEPAIRQLLRLVKSHYDLDLDAFLEELAGAADLSWNEGLERRLADEMICSWDQVRALAAAGMDIGSHTRSHRVLQTVPEADLADELGGSRADLEAALGRPVRAIAYPVGDPVVGHPAILRALEAAGYAVGFTNGTGASLLRLRRPHPMDVRRLALDRGDPLPFFRAVLAFPPLAHGG